MNSKLWYIAAFAALCISNAATAQVRPWELLKYSNNYYETGIKAGADFQQLSAYPFQSKYNAGATGGIYIKKRMNSFGVQLEVTASTAQYTTEYPIAHNYSLTPTHYADTVSKGVFNALYINVPLLFEVRPGRHFAIQMGAQYSYLLNIKEKGDLFEQRYGTEEVLSKSNISMLAGFELDIYKDLKMGARYAIGVSDLNANKFTPFSDQWHINSAQVFLAYRLDKFGVK